MTRLVIQIPCFNEEKTITAAIDDLPDHIDGIDEIEILVIDDGSFDKTVETVRKKKDDRIKLLTLGIHVGLGAAFHAGIEESLKNKADIIVNTDADLQYRGADIPALVEPILGNRADMVIGDRNVLQVPHFSIGKRLLHYIGNMIVNLVAGTKCRDVTSGFRAISKRAALALHPSEASTYTIDSAVQLHRMGFLISHIPIETRPPVRKSRLIRSLPRYLLGSVATLIRTTARYAPLRFLLPAGVSFFLGGFLLGLRFIYYYFFLHAGSGHIQSLLLATLLMNMGITLFSIGIIADLLASDRRILEEIYRATRKLS